MDGRQAGTARSYQLQQLPEPGRLFDPDLGLLSGKGLLHLPQLRGGEGNRGQASTGAPQGSGGRAQEEEEEGGHPWPCLCELCLHLVLGLRHRSPLRVRLVVREACETHGEESPSFAIQP